MFGCKDHLILDETPHVASAAIVNGGEGYTRATAKVNGTFEVRPRLRLIIALGVIVRADVIDPGRGCTSELTVTVSGDGTGAVITVAIGGGAAVYKNTTTVPNPDCATGCIATTPPGVCDPTDVPPSPRPVCDPGSYDNTTNPDGTNARTCHANTCGPFTPPILANTYALAEPRTWLSYALCDLSVSFKNAFIKKEWFGRYGFIDSEAPSQQKYLVTTATVTYSMSVTRRLWHSFPGGVGDGYYVTKRTATGTRVRTVSRNRYTNIETITDTESYHFIQYLERADDGSPDVIDYEVTAMPETLRQLALTNAVDGFISFVSTFLAAPYFNNGTVSDIIDQINTEGAALASGYSYTPIVSLTNDTLHVERDLAIADHQVDENGHDFTDDGFENIAVEVKLTGLYTPADVNTDGDELEALAAADMGDDGKSRWRKSVPLFSSLPAAHYVPQYGPSYGPFYSWVVGNDGATPEIHGVMKPAGYQPFFDSLHSNQDFVECSPGSGRYAFQNVGIGKFSPGEYGTATQWMIDNANNMWLPGANASFNSPPRQYQTCGGDAENSTLVLDAGTLYRTIWAEIIIRWPRQGGGASTGSYAIKTWNYRQNTLQSVTCIDAIARFQSCKPTAIFIQKSPLSGKWADAIRLDPPTVTFFDERRDNDGPDDSPGTPKGDWAIKQIYQAKAVVEGETTNYYEADCASTPETPGAPMAWSYVVDGGEM